MNKVKCNNITFELIPLDINDYKNVIKTQESTAFYLY